MRTRGSTVAPWTIAAWPTDYWASQVYPELSALEGKRKLAQDFLWFCRLSDEDGCGTAPRSGSPGTMTTGQGA